MVDDGPPLTTIAQPPFDDVDADIVLQTSDNVNFHVFRPILSLSSPLFQGMFTLPQPSNAVTCTNNSNANAHDRHGVPPNSLPVEVPEDSLTLDTLLRFLYPNTHPSFHDLLHASNVAVAASKYDMTVALDKIGKQVQTRYLKSQPLHVYFVACRMGWKDVAKAAAKVCLDLGTGTTRGVNAKLNDDLMQSGALDFPGAIVAYHRLEEYRKACRDASADKFCNTVLPENEMVNCKADEANITVHCLAIWIQQFLYNLRLAVLDCVGKDAFYDPCLLPAATCHGCSSMDTLHDIMTALMEAASIAESVPSEVQSNFVLALDSYVD